MGSKEASVKLDLDAANYAVALKRVGNQTENEGKKAARAFKPLEAGLDRVKKDFGELGGKLQGLLGQAMTLGGALSVGAGVKHAQDLIATYRDVAFAVEAATGQLTDWRQVQADVERASTKWRMSNERVAESFDAIFKSSGDLAFTRAGLDAAAKASSATGASLNATSGIVNELNQKLGITEDRIGDAMAKVVGLVGGKAGLEELAAGGFGELAASARSVGLSGEEGLTKTLGLLKMAGASGGNFKKELQSVVQLYEQLGDTDQVKRIEKTLAIKITDKSGRTREDALERIVAKTQGKREELSKVFSGPLLRFVTELSGTFQQAFADAAGTEKEKEEAALKKFRGAIEESAKSTMSAERFEQLALQRREDSRRRLDDAMNRFTASFERPQVVKAIDKLTENMPKLADLIANLVEFAAKHPVLAGGLAVGGRAALSFGAGAAAEAMAGRGARGGKADADGGSGTKGGKGGATDVGGKGAKGLDGGFVSKIPILGTVLVAAIGATTEALSTMDEMKARGSSLQRAGEAEIAAREMDALGGTAEEKEGAIARLEQAIQELKDAQEASFFTELFEGVDELLQSAGLTKKQQTEREIASQQERRLQELVERMKKDLEEARKKPPPATEEPPPAQKAPAKVKIEGEDGFARKLASYIRDGELRVRITNLQTAPGVSTEGGSRGPLDPRPPRSAGGTGGT